jgi:hypothetical protein
MPHRDAVPRVGDQREKRSELRTRCCGGTVTGIASTVQRGLWKKLGRASFARQELVPARNLIDSCSPRSGLRRSRSSRRYFEASPVFHRRWLGSQATIAALVASRHSGMENRATRRIVLIEGRPLIRERRGGGTAHHGSVTERRDCRQSHRSMTAMGARRHALGCNACHSNSLARTRTEALESGAFRRLGLFAHAAAVGFSGRGADREEEHGAPGSSSDTLQTASLGEAPEGSGSLRRDEARRRPRSTILRVRARLGGVGTTCACRSRATPKTEALCCTRPESPRPARSPTPG